MFKLFLLFLVISTAFAESSEDRYKRILGGRNAAIGQFPFQASLRPWGSSTHFVGGILISDRWVLTSAYHMIGRAGSSINIVLGIVSLSATFLSRQSIRIETHTGFSATTMQNDIACVQSASVIPFSSSISPIFMHDTVFPHDTIGQVSGWGATQPDKGPNSDILQFATVSTIDCVDDSPRIAHPNLNICAEAVVGPAGFCTSDVGGPLISGCGLIGIASWHHSPCGEQPDVYVRISWYRNWIRGITGI